VSLKTFLRIAPWQITNAWNTWAPKARIEPLVIQDGVNDYVLMRAADYAALESAIEVKKRPKKRIGSPDLDILIPALAEMARTNVPAQRGRNG